jgi:erythromycin esterase
MTRRTTLAFVLILLSLSLEAAPRRRAAGKASSYDESTPAGWLAANAYVLSTPDFVPFTGDLQPLRAMIGSAGVVALGDGTHGTHEFYTMKLRAIDMLVREAGFDVVALEGPFPLINRIDAYVQGGPGDGRALLREMKPMGYYYLDAEELLEIVEWMREYNAHRGDRPAVHISGFDVLEAYAASREVINYLNTVDPVGGVTAQGRYNCIPPGAILLTSDCEGAAIIVRDTLAAREAQLVPQSSAAAFHEALQNARVVVQSRVAFGTVRDVAMAQNALWLRDHRGSTRKIILWGHNAHLAKASSTLAPPPPMGQLLAQSLGSDYFSVATLTAAGTFRYWNHTKLDHDFATFGPLQPTAYESYIRQRGVASLLIPLRGTLPTWLTTSTRYNVGSGSGVVTASGSLPALYDAAIFIDTTTPLSAIAN